MSTTSPADVSNPDKNLVTSFVAMASGIQGPPTNDLPRERSHTTEHTRAMQTDVPNSEEDERTTTVRGTVECTPINEYTHLAQILSYAFPVEFPFGVTSENLGSTGKVLKRVLRRLTRVYDGRVAHNYVLLMYLANLLYRHAALAATSARVNMESSDAVVNIINHPEWQERSDIISNNPTGPEAKSLIKQIAPLVRLAGKKVPWSPIERLSASYHIYALYHTFGAPAYFVTFSPKVLTNQLMLTFGEMQNPDKSVDLTLPEHLQHRVQLLTSNTIAQARAYELMLDAVLTVLFGIKPESKCHKTLMPKPGLFGVPTAYYCSTECQARNALHGHSVVWVRTMHPEMIQRIAHDDNLRQVLVNVVDSVVTGSTENFEMCMSQSKVVCEFMSKPYGIRFQPTTTYKGVELKSVVWGSRASKFSLSIGMRMVSFAGTNVYNMNSNMVRDLIMKHKGRVIIVFEQNTVFDPNTGRVKSTQCGRDSRWCSGNQSKVSSVSKEARGCVSTGAVAESFFPPWLVEKSSSLSKSNNDNTDRDVNIHESHTDPDSVTSVETTSSESEKACNTSETNDHKPGDHLHVDPSDVDPSDDELCGNTNMLFDNILNQDFDATRLTVGDVFFDGNNGDACEVDNYTLGWVEVIAVHARSVFLSPIYSPQRPFVPKGLQDVSEFARQDVINSEYIQHRLNRIPVHILDLIRSRNCWQWDERLANKAAALSRLRVRGQIVMSAYNVHGFANGEDQRRHSHRCHKYKDTYKAKWCALGFGRTVFDNTDLRQIIAEENDQTNDGGDTEEGNNVDDVTVVRDHKDSKQEAYDKLRVTNLEKPDPPHNDGKQDNRVLCMDLRRKCGPHKTNLRKDVERATKDSLLDKLCRDVVLLSRVHHRVMSFLWNHEDEHHTYADQYMCETAPIMAALLGCNTNVSPLGGNVQAINALFYLTGYLSKNPVKPTSWITCIIAALKSMCKWDSVAKDMGTPSRNAKFFLQKVLNRLNALAEITDTQAAMLLLGFKSFQCSHRFSFCFHHQALETQMRIYNTGTNKSSPLVDMGSDQKTESVLKNGDSQSCLCGDDVESSNSDESDASSTQSSSEDSDSSEPKPVKSSCSRGGTASSRCKKEKSRNAFENSCGIPAGNTIYRDSNDVAFALSQHHHYLHRVSDWNATLPDRGNGAQTNDLTWWYIHARGKNDPDWRMYQRVKGLHDFTLTEYVRHIEVVEMPAVMPISGPVVYYLFSRNYPICDSHVQKLRLKHHVSVLSGRPPRDPGLNIKRRTGESDKSYAKRTLKWRLKADVYGRTMGSIFSPWNANGDCEVHSYEDFTELQAMWEDKQRHLRENREWQRYITRNRELDDDDMLVPTTQFPDPRQAARALHVRNLRKNLRVNTLMKRIANKWRYQNCDRFDDPKEYDDIHGDVKTSQEDKENAIAIASLLETFSQPKKGRIDGVGADMCDHLQRMRLQVENLYGNTASGDKTYNDCVQKGHKLDPIWYKKPLTSDIRWAKKTLKKIMEREPEIIWKNDGSNVSDTFHGLRDDDQLRSQMSPDQARAFDHAIECFDANKPLRIFVHGGPGTGKTFLANRIMKAAHNRGIDSRFTALSGAAATINNGTTIHYAMGMTKIIKWGREPTANQIKKIRFRNEGMRVLIVDEISMTHAQMWNQILQHLKHARLLDGLHIIAMGDMCQLPPPNQFVKPIYEDFILSARNPATYTSKPLVLAGVKSFQRLRKMELTTQNRAKGDFAHMQTIQQLRKGDINDEFINNLKPLSFADVNNDWKFVPILVTSNAEAILLNKRQIVEFAKTNNRFILKWTNPIRNCEDAESYDINTVEDIIPEAVQYFCMGAPGFVNANKNPVGTGIVNGYRVVQHSLIWNTNRWQPPKDGWVRGQIFEVDRPAYMVVIKDQTTVVNSGHNNVGTKIQTELIPLKMDYHKTRTQGVQISYKAFPFDLRFAITYHKVQGQTLNKVILFLHERRTRQLAPLQWESLYVAYTRVKCGNDIRVCYFGSNTRNNREGLSHLKRLRRPKLYDIWQNAYDKHGKWDDNNLRTQAENKRVRLQRKLRRVTSISQVSLDKLKTWATILDVNVPYKPGTRRKNKEQYIEAITPVWVGVNSGALTAAAKKTIPRKLTKPHSLQTKPSCAVQAVKTKLSTKNMRSRETKMTRSTRASSRNTNTRTVAVPPNLTTQERRNSTRLTMNLRSLVGGFRSKIAAKRAMKRVSYCVNVPFVAEISQWSAYAISTPGEFICDTVLYFCASHFCQDDGCIVHVVDPVLPFETDLLVQTGIRKKFLQRLHLKQQILAFPINVPRNVHWMVVFVWLNSAGKVMVQCRNSMRAYSNLEGGCCTQVRRYISNLYSHSSNNTFTCIGFGHTVPVNWTEQTPNVYACGIHVLSHIYLAAKGLAHSHTFDNCFVEQIRVYCVQLFYEYTCGRHTTAMRSIDLTLDNPRFGCMQE